MNARDCRVGSTGHCISPHDHFLNHSRYVSVNASLYALLDELDGPTIVCFVIGKHIICILGLVRTEVAIAACVWSCL